MAKVLLYHNPACSKSRGALEILEARGEALEIVEYLKAPLSETDLGALLKRLDTSPAALVRKDKHFKELGLDPSAYGEGVDPAAVVAILVQHPRLMERPVAVVGDRAVIGRPPENVLKLLG